LPVFLGKNMRLACFFEEKLLGKNMRLACFFEEKPLPLFSKRTDEKKNRETIFKVT